MKEVIAVLLFIVSLMVVLAIFIALPLFSFDLITIENVGQILSFGPLGVLVFFTGLFIISLD